MPSRPIVPGEDNHFVGVTFNESLFQRMEDALIGRPRKRSALIRDAVEHYLDQQDTEAAA